MVKERGAMNAVKTVTSYMSVQTRATKAEDMEGPRAQAKESSRARVKEEDTKAGAGDAERLATRRRSVQ